MTDGDRNEIDRQINRLRRDYKDATTAGDDAEMSRLAAELVDAREAKRPAKQLDDPLSDKGRSLSGPVDFTRFVPPADLALASDDAGAESEAPAEDAADLHELKLLEAAESDREIIQAAARIVGLAEDEIPTEADVYDWLVETTAWKMNEALLSQLQFQYDGALHVWLPGVPIGEPEPLRDGDTQASVELCQCLGDGESEQWDDCPVHKEPVIKPSATLYRCLEDGESKALKEDDSRAIRFPLLLGICFEARDSDSRRILPVAPVGRISRVHGQWRALAKKDRPEHPVVTLVKACQKWPRRRCHGEIDSEMLSLGIMPEGAFPHAPSGIYVGPENYDPASLPFTGYVDDGPSQPSLFPAGDTSRRRVRWEGYMPAVTPLVLADAAGFRGLTIGKGARMDKRLLVLSLLRMPLSQRKPGGYYEWRPQLREIVPLFWSDWKPSRNAGQLAAALDAVTLAKVRLEDGGTWRPVVVRGEPDYYKLNSHAIIQIELPKLSDRGAMVDVPGLIEDGKLSDPAFDLCLGLSYLWDEVKAANGGFRIYATRPKAERNREGLLLNREGEIIYGHPENPHKHKSKLLWKPGKYPQSDWRHPEAVINGHERHPQADKVPWLHPEARRRLAYGLKEQNHKGNRATERKNADRLIKRLEAQGRVVIEKNGHFWRILEVYRERAGSFPQVGPVILP